MGVVVAMCLAFGYERASVPAPRPVWATKCLTTRLGVGVCAPVRVRVAKRHQRSGLEGGCVEGSASYLNARAASVLARLSASVPV